MKPARLLSSRSRTSGFTLIEVLATLLLMAIVLPAVMQGISLAENLASTSRRRTEASSLAESKLGELITTNAWQNQSSMAGDFAPDWPDYKWTATVGQYPQDTTTVGLQEIDVRVTWISRGHEDNLTLSTVAYVKGTPTATP